MPAPVPYANLTNPQTLNLYAMVADDPESFVDLDGHLGEWGKPFLQQNPDTCTPVSTGEDGADSCEGTGAKYGLAAGTSAERDNWSGSGRGCWRCSRRGGRGYCWWHRGCRRGDV